MIFTVFHFDRVKVGVSSLYSCFRDKNTFQTFSADFKQFVDWLLDKYPEDAELKNHAAVFHHKYNYLPENVFTKELKRATSLTSKQEEVKKMLRNAFSTERRIADVYTPDMSSEEKCIQSFKELEQLIRSDKRNILLNSANQGSVLKHLKQTMKKKGSFIKSLYNKDILISLSHCNFLIAFNILAEQYPNIILCALELRFFTKHLKIVKEVAPEVFT